MRSTMMDFQAYFAIPGTGAVMHTLNIGLSTEQIRYIIGHAEDSVILADASLAPVLAPVLAAGGHVICGCMAMITERLS